MKFQSDEHRENSLIYAESPDLKFFNKQKEIILFSSYSLHQEKKQYIKHPIFLNSNLQHFTSDQR